MVLSTNPEIESILDSDALPLFKAIHKNILGTLTQLYLKSRVNKEVLGDVECKSETLKLKCLFHTSSHDLSSKGNGLIWHLIIDESGRKEFESIIYKITDIPLRVDMSYFSVGDLYISHGITYYRRMQFRLDLTYDYNTNIKLIFHQYKKSTLFQAMKYLELISELFFNNEYNSSRDSKTYSQ